MSPPADLSATLRTAWRTNNRVDTNLIEQIPPKLWATEVPGIPRRTIRAIAAHLHNARRRWIRTLGSENDLPVPERVDERKVTRKQLVAALNRSSRGIEAILGLALDAGGVLPAPKLYTWRNLPLDAGHILTYFVAHEAHHRGQIVMAARQLGMRLPRTAVDGLWQWSALVKQGIFRGTG